MTIGRKCVYSKGIHPDSYRDESLRLRQSFAVNNTSPTFYVYILQSLKDFSFYIGQCEDLDYRLSKHADGQSKYTSSKLPLRLVYFELYKTRTEAIKREKEIKNKKSRRYIEWLIKEWKKTI